MLLTHMYMWTNFLYISHQTQLVHLGCHSITKTKQGPFSATARPSVDGSFAPGGGSRERGRARGAAGVGEVLTTGYRPTVVVAGA